MSDPLTRAELDAALALAEAATPGPWEVELDLPDLAAIRTPGTKYIVLNPKIGRPETPEQEAQLRADCEMIAASRDLVPRLVAEVLRWRRLWAEIAYAYEGLQEARAILAEEKP